MNAADYPELDVKHGGAGDDTEMPDVEEMGQGDEVTKVADAEMHDSGEDVCSVHNVPLQVTQSQEQGLWKPSPETGRGNIDNETDNGYHLCPCKDSI